METAHVSMAVKKAACRELSLALREAQSDLRILRRINWPAAMAEDFSRGRISSVDPRKIYGELGFSPKEKRRRLNEIARKAEDRLGDLAAGKLLQGRVNEYLCTVQLLASAGTDQFTEAGRKFWGSSRDKLFSNGTTVAQYARALRKIIRNISTPELALETEKVIPAKALLAMMRAHFREAHLTELIELSISDKITANAVAGSGKIKIRKDALFSTKDIQVLIYHEAYTHCATGANGRSQPYAKFLGFDSPKCTSTQEGLAVLMEIFTNSTYPHRIQKIADRVIGVSLAEEGGTPADVYEYYRESGYSKAESYQLMSRVFRGTNLKGGQAFTKDIAYLTGLIECYNFIEFCLLKNKFEYVPLLFAGKLNVQEMPLIVQAAKDGFIDKPKWVPARFLDVESLSSWFICAAAFGQMGDPEHQSSFLQRFSS